MPSTDGHATPSLSLTVKRSNLLTELAAAIGAVEHKSTVPILSSFLLEGRSNHTLLVTATNLEVSLRTSCPAAVVAPGSCTVPARKFYDYIRLLPEGDVHLKLLENHWVEVRSGRSKTKMVGMPHDSFPKLPLFPSQSATTLSAPVLEELTRKTSFSISQDESRYIVSGALLVIRSGSVAMVATDGHRLAMAEAVDSTLSVSNEIRVLVPRKAITEMSGLLSASGAHSVSLAVNDSNLFLGVGNRPVHMPAIERQVPKLPKRAARRSDRISRVFHRGSAARTATCLSILR